MEKASKHVKVESSERQAAFDEGQIVDLGTIAVESVRIQYPQPRIREVVIGNKKIPHSPIVDVLKAE